MSTTAVVVELVITGIQAFTWIILIFTALAVSPEGVLSTLAQIGGKLSDANDWAMGLLFCTAGMAYAVGVVFDRLYDSLFERWLEPRVRNRQRRVKSCDGDLQMRFDILIHATGNAAQLREYVRSRVRLTRSTSVNCFITALVSQWLGFASRSHLRSFTLLACACLMLAVASLAAWWLLYRRHIDISHRLHSHYVKNVIRPNSTAGDQCRSVSQ
jgi:hypothetical protein